MLLSHHIIKAFVGMIQFLVGLLANGIIMVVNGLDLAKQQKLTPLELLLSCLAISRLCMQSFIAYIHLGVLSVIEVKAMPEGFAMFIFVNDMGIWLATWLSIFYCVKIATFAHPLFFWLKMRISKMVPWLVLGTLLYAMITSIFHSKYTWIFGKELWLSLFSKNVTFQIQETPAFYLVLFSMEFFLPLFIFLIFALLLICSLIRHTKQVRNTARGSKDCSTYIKALLSILSFLVLYLSHYMAAALLSSQLFTLSDFFFHFSIFVIGSYPSGHSIILILGNYKLKQNVKKLLFHSKYCVRENIDLGPGSGDQ